MHSLADRDHLEWQETELAITPKHRSVDRIPLGVLIRARITEVSHRDTVGTFVRRGLSVAGQAELIALHCSRGYQRGSELTLQSNPSVATTLDQLLGV